MIARTLALGIAMFVISGCDQSSGTLPVHDSHAAMPASAAEPGTKADAHACGMRCGTGPASSQEASTSDLKPGEKDVAGGAAGHAGHAH